VGYYKMKRYSALNSLDFGLLVGSESMLLILLSFIFQLFSHLQSPESRFYSRQAEPLRFGCVFYVSGQFFGSVRH